MIDVKRISNWEKEYLTMNKNLTKREKETSEGSELKTNEGMVFGRMCTLEGTMPALICNLPAYEVWVRKEYLLDHKGGHGEFVKGVWVSVKVYQ